MGWGMAMGRKLAIQRMNMRANVDISHITTVNAVFCSKPEILRTNLAAVTSASKEH